MNKNLVVLLIDDDQDDQLFFQMAIDELEINVECSFASDGIKGLAMLNDSAFHPDFIFLDINMPRMNGFTCLEKIKNINRLNDVPIYLYSTSADNDLSERCLKLGAAGLIKKEINLSDICEKLLNIFESKIASN
jgi:CheY-like chemotaxis protein